MTINQIAQVLSNLSGWLEMFERGREMEFRHTGIFPDTITFTNNEWEELTSALAKLETMVTEEGNAPRETGATPREKVDQFLAALRAEPLPSYDEIERKFGAKLTLTFTNVLSRFPCLICVGNTGEEELHYMIDGRFHDLICRRCGEHYAPDLAAVKRAWDDPGQTLTDDQLAILRVAAANAGWSEDDFEHMLHVRAIPPHPNALAEDDEDEMVSPLDFF